MSKEFEFDYNESELAATHTRKPFMAKDGQGAEVKVRTGVAFVKSYREEDSGVMRVDLAAQRLRFNMGGWIARDAVDLKDFIIRHAEERKPFQFRIEASRKRDIPADEKFDHIQSKDLRSLIVAAAEVDAGPFTSKNPGWIHSGEILTNPDLDPADGGVSAFGTEPAPAPAPASVRAINRKLDAYGIVCRYAEKNHVDVLDYPENGNEKEVSFVISMRKRLSDLIMQTIDKLVEDGFDYETARRTIIVCMDSGPKMTSETLKNREPVQKYLDTLYGICKDVASWSVE